MTLQKKGLDRRVRRSKQAFKRTLLDLMKEKTFQSITITEIVERADYNRTTFYSHYGQKEDLVDEIVDDMIAGLITAFRNPYKDVHYVDLNTISPSAIALFDYILENKEFYRLIINTNVLPGFQEKMIQTIQKLMKEDMVFLHERSKIDIDTDFFIIYRAYGIFGIVLEWIKSDYEKSAEYLAKQLINILNFHSEKVIITI